MKEFEQDMLNSTLPDISNLTRGLRKIGARTHWAYREYGRSHALHDNAVPDDAKEEIPENATDIRLIREGEVLFESRIRKQKAVHTHGRSDGSTGNVPFKLRPKAS